MICVISGKGGVGKTSLASNLAAALCELGEEVVVLDANLTAPNLGYHLGFHLVPKTLHDFLKGESELREVMYSHPLGFKVIPGGINVNDVENVSLEKLPEVTLSLLGKADYIIIDSSAGLGRDAIAALNACEEVLVVTNPDIPSVTDALRTIKIAQRQHKKILGAVVNRVTEKPYELSVREIEDLLGVPVLIKIPEDDAIKNGISTKQPAVIQNPNSPASVQIRKLAHMLVGRRFEERKQISLFHRLFGWIFK